MVAGATYHGPVEAAVKNVLEKDCIMFPLYEIPFIFRSVLMKPWLLSCYQPDQFFGVLNCDLLEAHCIVASSSGVVFGIRSDGTHCSAFFSFSNHCGLYYSMKCCMTQTCCLLQINSCHTSVLHDYLRDTPHLGWHIGCCQSDWAVSFLYKLIAPLKVSTHLKMVLLCHIPLLTNGGCQQLTHLCSTRNILSKIVHDNFLL